MSNTILTSFSSIPELNQPITDITIKYLEYYCAAFETKENHSLALNGHLLGVYPMYFLKEDSDLFFAYLQIPEQLVKNAIKKATYIDLSYHIVSSPYNQLTIWIAHLIISSKTLSEDLKQRGLLALFKMLHYKFMTSIVNHSYQHGADKNAMEATVRRLSNKFDIIQYGTWKKVIEARSLDIFTTNSIHCPALMSYDNDKAVNYILTDIQTRLRHKIRLVTQEYYHSKEIGDTIGTYDLVDEVDGKKVITATSNTFDLMISGIITQCQSAARFIDNELIKVICSQFMHVHDDTFRKVLITFTEMASMQANSGDIEKIGTTNNGEKIYIGASILLREFIQKTYRHCILTKTDMNSKTNILIKVKNLYTSSRVNNEDILLIKRSIVAFVLGCGESQREATNASIALAFLLYITVKTFDYI